jgi:hypothetical protein
MPKGNSLIDNLLEGGTRRQTGWHTQTGGHAYTHVQVLENVKCIVKSSRGQQETAQDKVDRRSDWAVRRDESMHVCHCHGFARHPGVCVQARRNLKLGSEPKVSVGVKLIE